MGVVRIRFRNHLSRVRVPARGSEPDPVSFQLLFLFIALSGWVYWLFCVSRFHKILGEISRNRYPISSGEAAYKHIIPFYNLVWIFQWPTEFSTYLNTRGRVKIISGKLIGALLLVGLLSTRFFDPAVGLALIFSVGLYLSAKLRRHTNEIKALSPDALPPPPDPNMFRAAPAVQVQSDPAAPEPHQNAMIDGLIQNPTQSSGGQY